MGQESWGNWRCPRWAELPGLPLYMDQVELVLGGILGPFGKDAAMTPMMINNYVKHKLAPPPLKKKYGREHLAALVLVGVLKRALSLEEIGALLSAVAGQYGTERGYDLFCEKLESALRAAFETGEPWGAAAESGAESALDAALSALAGKMLLRRRLSALCPDDGQGEPPRRGKKR